MEHAELQLIPENTHKVEGKDASLVLRLVELLEEHDDVQHVYTNLELDEAVMASINAS